VDEVWLPLEDSKYLVSNMGRVQGPRSLLRPTLRKGYWGVAIYLREGNTLVRRTTSVHRLVASVFCDRGEGKSQVNHIDGNKQNNFYKNLEWVTPLENSQHDVRTGLHNVKGENCGMSKLDPSQVSFIRDLYAYSEKLATSKVDKIFSSTRLAKIFGVTHSTIGRIIRKETWN